MKELSAPNNGEASSFVSGEEQLRTLRVRCEEQRTALSDTVQQLGDKLGETASSVREAVGGTQDVLQTADEAVKKHRWMFVAGAFALGAALGHRRRSVSPKLSSASAVQAAAPR